MAYPSDLVRTINWGTETLTDSDLEGQLDLIINWVMASMNSSTGHKHDATDNEAPQIAAGGLATDAVETAKIKDANVTKAKIENLADYKVLGNVSGGAAAPAEVALLDEDDLTSDSDTSLATQQSIKAYADAITTALSIADVNDYGTSTSSPTAKNQNALRICYGRTTNLASGATHTVTDLGMTSATSYSTVACYLTASGLNTTLGITQTNGNSLSIKNNAGTSQTIVWVAIGT